LHVNVIQIRNFIDCKFSFLLLKKIPFIFIWYCSKLKVYEVIIIVLLHN
jgi:hypothetical protein